MAVSEFAKLCLVKADYGGQRVIAEIQRVDLDDYFERSWPHLTGADRRTLVEGNSDIIGGYHTQRRCEAGEWRDEVRPGGTTVKRVEIKRADLFGGPRMTDARLVIQKSAGFVAVAR